MNFPEKRIIIGIALAAVLPFQAFGQNDSLMNIKPQGSELRIEAAGFGITLGNNENAGFHDPYSPGKHRQARVSTSLGIASIDFGFNILNGVSYYGPWSGLGDFLDMRGGKSIRRPGPQRLRIPHRRDKAVGGQLHVLGAVHTASGRHRAAYAGKAGRVHKEIEDDRSVHRHPGEAVVQARQEGIPHRLRLLGPAAEGAHEIQEAENKGQPAGNIPVESIRRRLPVSVPGADAHTISVGIRFGI